MINLKYDVEDRDYGMISGKYPRTEYIRPTHELENLGIKYSLWKSNMMAGCIVIFDCRDVPEELPGYITTVDGDLQNYHNRIHHGVSITTDELTQLNRGKP